MTTALEKEFNYYLENQSELVKKYLGRFIVIKNCEVIGDYAGELEAFEKTTAKGEQLGTFLIQHCLPGSDSYSNTFYSRVSI